MSFAVMLILLPQQKADGTTFRLLDNVRTKGNVRLKGVNVETGTHAAQVVTDVRADGDITITDSTFRHGNGAPTKDG